MSITTHRTAHRSIRRSADRRISHVTAAPGDAKIDRITRSWLGGDADAAHWLASVADEVVVSAGTTIGGGRFVYVLLDTDMTCRVVAGGVAPIVVDQPTRVLVFAESELTDAVGRFPALTDAWAAGLARCAAAA